MASTHRPTFQSGQYQITPQTEPEILGTKHPRYPQFGFEWHRRQQKVYVILIPGQWLEDGSGNRLQFIPDPEKKTTDGLCIAEHCLNHAQFLGDVQTFLRGYNFENFLKVRKDNKHGSLHF